ncbi:MAG: hypothetical protein HUU01_08275 [Saprospiraceae bacterium]|nr:hypothetical protein [Saprospiraceae bacterium]
MKIDLVNAFYVIKHRLSRILESRLFWIIVGIGIIAVVFSGWDENQKVIRVFGFPLERFSLGKTKHEALRVWFYEIISLIWIALIFFIYSKVIVPINQSFVVSQSLWLRLSPLSNVEVAISRVLFIVVVAFGLGCVVLALAILYMLLSGSNFYDLLIPVYGVIGYVLLSGGLVVAIPPLPTADRVSKQIRTIAATAFIPFLLYYPIGYNISEAVSGFAPFAIPFVAETIGFRAERPFISAGITGLFLLLIHPVFALLFTLKNKNY